MISDEIASAVARFFAEGKGPSHDELTRAFRRAGLSTFDPGTDVGKMKRVRDVLSQAITSDPDAGGRLVENLIALCRAAGSFRPGSDNFPSDDIVSAASEAFTREGFELDPDGNLRAKLLDQLDGVELTQALWAYVRRARLGVTDADLVSGTVKDLVEATARHALEVMTGSYQPQANFPTTLYNAFDRLGLVAAAPNVTGALDADPRRALEQATYLLAIAVNRLRNAEGTGHGRPASSTLTQADAQLVSVAAGLCAQMMLQAIQERDSGSIAS